MATTQVETVSTGADKAKVGAAIALVIAALAGFYLLGRQGQVAQWGVLLVGLIAAVAIFFTSESGKQFVAFGRDSVKAVIRDSARDALVNGRWDAIGELLDGLPSAKSAAAKLPYMAA